LETAIGIAKHVTNAQIIMINDAMDEDYSKTKLRQQIETLEHVQEKQFHEISTNGFIETLESI